jgi:hypothetical protein
MPTLDGEHGGVLALMEILIDFIRKSLYDPLFSIHSPKPVSLQRHDVLEFKKRFE